MKLLGELKDKVEKAENQEEAKKIIKEAGMELNDDELELISGGYNPGYTSKSDPMGVL